MSLSPEAERAVHAERILTKFIALDRALQAKGFPPTSPWWHKTIRRWYKAGKRQLTARVGRRGGKSSTLCRLGVVEALYGDHVIPPGDVGVVAIVSARRPDAMERLRTIKAILDALNVPYAEKGDSIELTGKRRIAFTVFTASIAGVSGFTGIFLFLDEVAKWKDSDTGVNPANEVIKSIRPTMATQKNAKIVLSSSPMGYLDAHADSFALGDTALQTTAFATTWDANPTITELDTHELEPDKVTRDREYGAIPQTETEFSLLSEASLKALERTSPAVFLGDDERDDRERHWFVATMDPATRGNAWTFAVSCLSDGRVRRVCFTHEWIGSKAKPLRASVVFKEMAPMLAAFGLRHVYSDQWSEDTLRELAAQQGVYLIVDPPWTDVTKSEAYDNLQTLVKEKLIELPPDAQIRADLLGIRQKLTRSGIRYDLMKSGARHADFAPTIAMGLMIATVPPKPKPERLDPQDHANRVKIEFLKAREKQRKKTEHHRRITGSSRLPPTHRR